MKHLNEHESAVRSFVNKANDLAYKAIDNFTTAKHTENAYVIFEGDDGGQIYLTCPMKYVYCTESTLLSLLEHIDRIE